MKIKTVYDDGCILPEALLNLDPASLLNSFTNGVRNITGLSLSAGYPIEATVPLLINNAFRNIAAISLESGYKFYKIDLKLNKLNLHHQQQQVHQLQQKPRLKSKPRNKPLKFKPHHLQHNNKKWTSVVCSIDQYLNINLNNYFLLIDCI